LRKRIKKVSTRELIQYLVKKLMFHVFKQDGSHIQLIQENNGKNDVTIPLRKEIGRGTLESVFSQIGYPIQDFYAWCNA
jgi:predicted RNA binding protein YcfA (HicA-like mRNA interferase family)